jgi:hypothetical protein
MYAFPSSSCWRSQIVRAESSKTNEITPTSSNERLNQSREETSQFWNDRNHWELPISIGDNQVFEKEPSGPQNGSHNRTTLKLEFWEINYPSVRESGIMSWHVTAGLLPRQALYGRRDWRGPRNLASSKSSRRGFVARLSWYGEIPAGKKAESWQFRPVRAQSAPTFTVNHC